MTYTTVNVTELFYMVLNNSGCGAYFGNVEYKFAHQILTNINVQIVVCFRKCLTPKIVNCNK